VVTEIAIGLAVLALLIYRQLHTRPVNASGLRIVAALAGSLALAAGFGVLRAATVRIWLQDGQPWSRGSWITASLWIVALAVHLGYDALVAGPGQDNVGAATIVLYLAVSLAIQRLIVRLRAQRLQSGSVRIPTDWVR